MTAIDGVLFLHVLSAAAWLGASIWTPGDVRRSLALGQPATGALPQRVRPALTLDLWAGIATLFTGIALVALQGAGAPRAGILVGFGAVLIRLVLLVLGIQPTWRRVEVAIDAGDLAAASVPARRLAMLGGIGHLLWVVALSGMVFDW